MKPVQKKAAVLTGLSTGHTSPVSSVGGERENFRRQDGKEWIAEKWKSVQGQHVCRRSLKATADVVGSADRQPLP